MFGFVFSCVLSLFWKTHYLSRNVAIPIAMLIHSIYLTYCKICDRLKGYQDTDIASLTDAPNASFVCSPIE